MNDRAGDSRALVVATALRDLGREERRLIQEGHFDGLGDIAARRAELLRELDRELKPGWPAEPALHSMLETVRQEGADNLTLWRSLHLRANGSPRSRNVLTSSRK